MIDTIHLLWLYVWALLYYFILELATVCHDIWHIVAFFYDELYLDITPYDAQL